MAVKHGVLPGYTARAPYILANMAPPDLLARGKVTFSAFVGGAFSLTKMALPENGSWNFFSINSSVFYVECLCRTPAKPPPPIPEIWHFFRLTATDGIPEGGDRLSGRCPTPRFGAGLAAEFFEQFECRAGVGAGGGAEGVAEFEVFAADAKGEGGGRRGVFGLQVDLKHGFRWKFVGGVGDAGGGFDLAEGVGGRGVFAGVDEQGKLAALQVEGVFDLELEVFDQLELPGQLFIFEPFFELTAEFRPDRIVAAAGVADGENDDRCAHDLLRACTWVPSGSMISTSSGILPSAWVAQERQGSKARMATSMWLSSPSVTSRPLR